MAPLYFFLSHRATAWCGAAYLNVVIFAGGSEITLTSSTRDIGQIESQLILKGRIILLASMAVAYPRLLVYCSIVDK